MFWSLIGVGAAFVGLLAVKLAIEEDPRTLARLLAGGGFAVSALLTTFLFFSGHRGAAVALLIVTVGLLKAGLNPNIGPETGRHGPRVKVRASSARMNGGNAQYGPGGSERADADPEQASDETAGARKKPPGAMTRAEAFRILGIQEDASGEEIRAAHRRLMKQAHPDAGGSNYLATKINQAKDFLLKAEAQASRS